MFKCKTCDKEFSSQRGLNAHQISHKKGQRYSVSRKSKKQKYYVCLNCGKQQEKTTSSRNKFCSNNCSAEYVKKETIKRIKNGEVLSIGTMKSYLVNTRGVCDECGIGNSYNGKPLTLQIDHINGNSDDNNLDNLRLLCPNCHSQTETYGSKGNGNRYRKYTKRNNYLRKYKASFV